MEQTQIRMLGVQWIIMSAVSIDVGSVEYWWLSVVVAVQPFEIGARKLQTVYLCRLIGYWWILSARQTNTFADLIFKNANNHVLRAVQVGIWCTGKRNFQHTCFTNEQKAIKIAWLGKQAAPPWTETNKWTRSPSVIVGAKDIFIRYQHKKMGNFPEDFIRVKWTAIIATTLPYSIAKPYIQKKLFTHKNAFFPFFVQLEKDWKLFIPNVAANMNYGKNMYSLGNNDEMKR